MGTNVAVMCESGMTVGPENDIRLVSTFIEDLDKRAAILRVTPLGSYGLLQDLDEFGPDDDVDMDGLFFDPQEVIRTLDALVAATRSEPRPELEALPSEDLAIVREELGWLIAGCREAKDLTERVRLVHL